MEWSIMLKILSWIPVGLEMYVIAKNVSRKKWQTHQGKMELIAWIAALSTTTFNAIYICLIAV